MTNLANQNTQTIDKFKKLFRPDIVITFLIIFPLILLDLYAQKGETLSLIRQLSIGASFLILTIITNIIVRRFASFSLRTKLIMVFLAITFATTLPLFFLSRNAIRTNLTDSANQKLFAAASQTAVIVEDFLQNKKDIIRVEAKLITLEFEGDFGILEDILADPEFADEILEHLSAYRDKNPINITSYALLDLNGQPILEVPETNNKENESDQTYFTTPLENEQPYVSPIQFSETEEPSLYFSSVIRNGSGEVVGVLRARHKAEVLQELIATSTGLAGGQSFAVLFDENYLHLAHGLAPETIFQLVAPLEPAKVEALQLTQRLPNIPINEMSTNLPELADNLSKTRNVPFFEVKDVATGEDINQVAVVHLGTLPWLIGFFQPQNVFLAPVKVQSRSILLFTGLIAVLVILFAIALSQLLTRPLIQLNDVALKVAKGDLSIKATVYSKDEIGTLASSFNSMTEQLQDIVANLEERIDERTRALVTSAEIGRRLSLILDREQLASEVVTQVQSAFNYYHAHIYLFDETNTMLEMVAGTGEAGQTMLTGRHQLKQTQGLVGRAATANQVVLISDVSKDSEWLPNPLLPETKAEIAVPIAIGDQVMGVLDVQHHIANGLSQQDADLLLSITNQVAIALQNARLLENVRQQAEQEAKISYIAQQIQSSKTVDEALQVAVREIGRAVGSPQTAVRLTHQSNIENGIG